MRAYNNGITLKDVLRSRNVNGDPYRSDVSLWLGKVWDIMEFKEKGEIIEKLKELQNV